MRPRMTPPLWPPTTAGVTINEGADPAVAQDLESALVHVPAELRRRRLDDRAHGAAGFRDV